MSVKRSDARSPHVAAIVHVFSHVLVPYHEPLLDLGILERKSDAVAVFVSTRVPAEVERHWRVFVVGLDLDSLDGKALLGDGLVRGLQESGPDLGDHVYLAFLGIFLSVGGRV